MDILKINHIRYGLIMSVLTIVCLTLMQLTGNNQSFNMDSPYQLIFMIFGPFVVWLLGIRARKQMQKGKLTFKEGLAEGFKISLVYAVLSPFIFLGYYTFFNPEIVDFVRSAYMLDGWTYSSVVAFDMTIQFVMAVIMGTIYAAVLSFFLKSK